MLGKSKYIIQMVIVLAALASCRKDPLPPILIDINPSNPFNPCAESYSDFSISDYEKELKELVNPDALTSPTGFIEPNCSTFYSEPVFNPSNPYEIIYAKKEVYSAGDEELWKFNFCNGQSTFIANNFSHFVDWSINGWLLYTATNNQIFRIKEDGDSITQITNQSGINNTGKWSPNGSKFFMINGSLKILNFSGNELYSTSGLPVFNAVDWIDEERLLIVQDGVFKSFNFQTGEKIQIQPTPVCHVCTKIFDRKHFLVFIGEENGEGGSDWMKFDLNTGVITTLQELAPSYQYGKGDVSPESGKLIMPLVRSRWKDSVNNEIYYRRDLILLDENGAGERIITFPN